MLPIAGSCPRPIPNAKAKRRKIRSEQSSGTMPLPKIRFSSLPRPLWEHILARLAERRISLQELRPASVRTLLRRLQEPDVASSFLLVEHHHVRANRQIEYLDVQIPERPPPLVGMINGERISGGMHIRPHGLRPNAAETVTVRREDDQLSVGGKMRLIVPAAVGDRNPLAPGYEPFAKRYGIDARRKTCRRIESDPAPIRRKMSVPHPVFRIDRKSVV